MLPRVVSTLTKAMLNPTWKSPVATPSVEPAITLRHLHRLLGTRSTDCETMLLQSWFLGVSCSDFLWKVAIGVSGHSREGYGFRPSPRWASRLPELLLLRDVGRLSRGSPGRRGWARASSRACPWPSLPDCITTQPPKVGFLVFFQF